MFKITTNVLEEIAKVYVLFGNKAWESSVYIPDNFEALTDIEKANYRKNTQIFLKRMIDTDLFYTLFSWGFNEIYEHESFETWLKKNIYFEHKRLSQITPTFVQRIKNKLRKQKEKD